MTGILVMAAQPHTAMQTQESRLDKGKGKSKAKEHLGNGKDRNGIVRLGDSSGHDYLYVQRVMTGLGDFNDNGYLYLQLYATDLGGFNGYAYSNDLHLMTGFGDFNGPG